MRLASVRLHITQKPSINLDTSIPIYQMPKTQAKEDTNQKQLKRKEENVSKNTRKAQNEIKSARYTIIATKLIDGLDNCCVFAKPTYAF